MAAEEAREREVVGKGMETRRSGIVVEEGRAEEGGGFRKKVSR